jgi:ribulose-5-phosphate 4-epimerase/fuculose-1-phosphate aldolase
VTHPLIAAARHLATRGLSPGSSGNLSIRTPQGILITPTGSSLSRVEPGDLAVLGLDGAVRTGRPSKEWALHLAAYAADPGVEAVVHLHSPDSTAIACLPPTADGLADLPAYTPYRVMSLGDVPLLPYAAPGSAELGPPFGAAVAAGRRVVLLANHGSAVAAESLDRAVDLAEELEASAHLALTLRTLPARPLPGTTAG